jgi:transcriptional regulatory protein AMDR
MWKRRVIPPWGCKPINAVDGPPSILLLQAIILVGAHVSLENPQRDSLKSAFYIRAKILFNARFEKNRDTVVQAALLLTWYYDGLEEPGTNPWFWVGIVARTAIGLGMHVRGGFGSLRVVP